MQGNELKKALQKLEEKIGNVDRKNHFSIFLVMIENLPMLNLSFGHVKTNEILLALQAEIAQKFANGISISRIASEQILIIYDESAPPRLIEAETAIKKTIRSFGTSSELKLHIAATLGYIMVEDANISAEDYLSKLYHDTFMSTSKAEFFENISMHEKSRQEMVMANKINEAIIGDELHLAYQPIINTESGRINHYEALLRLKNADGELESAGMFIPIAERMGFIDLIDHKTLQMTIAKLIECPDAHIAVNISHLTIGNRAWLKTFFSDVTADIAKRMIIEITETAANHNLSDTAYFIATLQEAGCQVALDDFGSGHTSYRQVRALSIDMVKIDGSLIRDIETNTHNQILVEALVKYFKEYGLKTVAEHVDSGSCAKFLTSYGVDYMQGNYFGIAGEI